MRIRLDLEVRSEVDLTVAGTWLYSLHPSTRVLCISITDEGGNVKVYDLFSNDYPPAEWRLAVENGWEICAWNSWFEYCIITNVLPHWPQPKLNMWRDLMYTACCNARPAKLSECAKALNLPEQKDVNGTALINFFCKPIATGAAKGGFREPMDHPERFAELMAYCRQDVVTMLAIERALTDPTPADWQHYTNTLEMNLRGLHVDRALVDGLAAMTDTSRALIVEGLQDKTGFDPADLSNHKKVLSHVNENGLYIESVAKPSVREALDQDISKSARLVLEARQATGKTSLSKLASSVAALPIDGRLRDLIRPNGTLTGRDSGWILTLPRGEKGLKADKLIAAVKAGDTQGFLDASYRASGDKKVFDPLGAVSACLRGCFDAGDGKVLMQCDWAAIEPRLAAWVVGDEGMVKLFHDFDSGNGPDIYQVFAARFYGCQPAEIKGDRRQFGKVGELLNLYAGGGKTIQSSAKAMYGLDLDIDTCTQCKDVWRATHPKHVEMWYALNDGAISATKIPGRVIAVGPIRFRHDGRDLRMRLPGGRVVVFPDATIGEDITDWGSVRNKLLFRTVVHGKMVDDYATPGSLFNAVIQGLGASLMRDAVARLRDHGYNVVLRCHDELVVEVDKGSDFARFKTIFLTPPAWAPDLAINGEGWIAERYKK